MNSKPHIVGPASELPTSDRFCTCCKRPLRGRVAYLELDQRTGAYHDNGGIPPEQSQGWFPFGLTCAERLNKESLIR